MTTTKMRIIAITADTRKINGACTFKLQKETCMITKVRRAISVLLMVSIGWMGVPLSVQAGMVTTDAAVASGDRDRIANMLDRADVRAQLQTYGVKASDVKARIATLTDEEAAQLAKQIDNSPAGGDAVGAIVGAAVLVFIVLLITDLLGLTHVFPFTKPIR